MELEELPDLRHPPASSQPPKDRFAAPRPQPRRRRKRLIWLYIPIVAAFLSAATGVLVGASIQRPEVDSLDHFVPRLVTTLYDRHDQPIRTYQRENRILLAENEIPDLLQKAVLAAEDSSFFQHGGVDLKGVIRAVIKNLLVGRREEGASTITMQLARELFLTRAKVWRRKIEETFLAVELEKKYSKQQILTLYLNLINLSQGNYGMEAAARNYFNKSVKDLSVAEAATLAGIPQRPSFHNVYERPEAVRNRRNVVLGRMLEEGFIVQETHDRAAAEPLLIVPRQQGKAVGSYFSEDVRRFVAATYGTTALYDRGLQVHTTLDRDIQRAAEAALHQGLLELDHNKRWRGPKDHIEALDLEAQQLPSWSGQTLIPGQWYEGIVLESDDKQARVKIQEEIHALGKDGIKWTRKARPNDLLKRGDVAWFRLEVPGDRPDSDRPDGDRQDQRVMHLEQEPELEGAVVVLESATGAVRAMVGGWDFNRNEFNRVSQAKRQVGSAFKPFVFGAAFESGFTPADTLFDGPTVFPGANNEPTYSPRNHSRRYYGILTLRAALEDSINVSSVKLLDLVGLDRTIDFARRCGITSDLPPYPSLALGVASITPLELAAAYASFVNQGIHVEPYLIEKVTSRDGRVLQEHLPRAHKAMEPEIAYLLTHILQGVVHGGTATHGLAGIDLTMAGKTGTTDLYSDAWFVGFTPSYTVLVWVGYDKNRSIGRGMTGAAAALPIWRLLIERGLEDGWLTPGEFFAVPPGITEVEVEAHTGLRFGPGAKRMIKEAFIEGTEPEQKYDSAWARVMELPWYLQEPFYLPKEGERMPAHIDDWSLVQEAWDTKNR